MMDQSMYEAYLSQIEAMPDTPEKQKALAALVRSYKEEQAIAQNQSDFGAEAALMPGAQGTQTGGKYGTYVAANPLEHLASGLRTYKGYKDMGEARDNMKEMALEKQKALQAMQAAMLKQGAQPFQMPGKVIP